MEMDMDDNLFQYWVDFQRHDDDVLWFDAGPPIPTVYHRRSAFVNYSRETLLGSQSKVWGNRPAGPNNAQNVHKRLMEFLKTTWKSPAAERERNHKHMINERMRRVKQKQGYTELYNLLPLGTKNDKNSIVQTAAETIERLQREEEELQRRELELEMAMADDHKGTEVMEEAKIKLKVAHPSSGIDSMLEVLKSLRSSGAKTKALQSNFTSQEFSAVLHVEAKIAAENVEKAVQKALYEVEKKFRSAPSIQ